MPGPCSGSSCLTRNLAGAIQSRSTGSPPVLPVVDVPGHSQGMHIQGAELYHHHHGCQFVQLGSPHGDPDGTKTVWTVWTGGLKKQHQLKAAHLALRQFQALISGHHVLILTDNVTTKAHIHRGGTHSRTLMRETGHLGHWVKWHLLFLRAEHISGISNIKADWLSRATVDHAE